MRRQGCGGGALHPFTALEVVDGDAGLATDAVNELSAEGLVYTEGRGGGGLPTTWISEAGSGAVRALRERRLNRRQRAVACREALLDWGYDRPNWSAVEDFAGDVRAHFEGHEFSQEEIWTAAADLMNMGFIEGPTVAELPAPIRFQLTVDGKKVVEDYDGSISKYERRDQMSSNVYHVTGNSGVVSVGDNNNITQNQGARLDELLRLLREVTEAARGTEVEEQVLQASQDLVVQANAEKPTKELLLAGLDQLESTVKKSAQPPWLPPQTGRPLGEALRGLEALGGVRQSRRITPVEVVALDALRRCPGAGPCPACCRARCRQSRLRHCRA